MIAEDLKKKVQALEIKALHLVDSVFSGEYETVFRGNGLEFRDLREYEPGDDVRSMDWKVTARTGRPHLRRYTQEREQVIYFLVDLSASTLLGRKRELLLELTTLLALVATKNRDRISLIAFSDRVEGFTAPGRGEGHLFRFLRTLVDLAPASRLTRISAGLEFLDKVTPRRSVVFVLSDFADAEFKPPLARKAREHDLTAVLVRDPWEAGEGPRGLFPVRDLESGRLAWVDTASKAWKNSRAFAFEESRLALKTFCLRSGAGFLSLEAGKEYFPELVNYFRFRERVSHG